MLGHDPETGNHDEPKSAVTIDRNERSRCRNGRSRWTEIPTTRLRYDPVGNVWTQQRTIAGRTYTTSAA